MNLIETAIALVLSYAAMVTLALGFVCWMISSMMEFVQSICGRPISPVTKNIAKVANATILISFIPAAVVLAMLWMHFGK